LLEPVRGAVLSTFGAGNAPDRPDLVAVLREVCDRGVVIVAISQCAKGGVGDTYETGRRLLEAGVIPGADMTLEVRPCCGRLNEIAQHHFRRVLTRSLVTCFRSQSFLCLKFDLSWASRSVENSLRR
jgi:hypothetical protein